MHDYVPYDVMLEERITSDRELRFLFVRLGAGAVCVFRRVRHWLFKPVGRGHSDHSDPVKASPVARKGETLDDLRQIHVTFTDKQCDQEQSLPAWRGTVEPSYSSLVAKKQVANLVRPPVDAARNVSFLTSAEKQMCERPAIRYEVS